MAMILAIAQVMQPPPVLPIKASESNVTHDHNCNDCNMHGQSCPDDDDDDDEQSDAYFNYTNVFDRDPDAYDVHVSDDGTNSQINPTNAYANRITSDRDDDEIEYDFDDTAFARANSPSSMMRIWTLSVTMPNT